MKQRSSQAEQVETIAGRLDNSDPEAAAMLRKLFVALGTQSVTSEAVGMLRERYGLSSDHAFDVMLRISGQDEVKRRVVAERVRSGESMHDDYAGTRETG